MKKPILTKSIIFQIFILLLFSNITIVFANTDPMHVYGTIYIDNSPTTPNQVHLLLPNQTYLGRLSENGLYDIYFLNQAPGVIGSFQIILSGVTWLADEEITIEQGLIEYSVDLHIQTSDNDGNLIPPKAVTNGPYNANISNQITFDGSESYDPDGTIIEYIWDYGDGNTSTGVVTTHNYNDVGQYTVVLTVRDDDGLTGYTNTEAIISSESFEQQNYSPIALAGGPYYEIINELITFDGSGSYDPDGTIIEYIWDFGDGNIAIGKTVTHKYTKAGRYDISLKVIDNDIDFNIYKSYVIITAKPNYPPNKPNIIGPKSFKINTIQIYNIESTDPDGDNIRYILDWGDGSDITKTQLVSNGTSVTSNHTWVNPGLYELTVHTEDEFQVMSEKTVKNILVNSIFCGNIGILIDYTNDGIYDFFQSNITHNKTSVLLSQNTYIIDIDGDENWDYTFDVNSGSLNLYVKNLNDFFDIENLAFYFGIILIITLILITIIFSYKKIKKKNQKKVIYYAKEKKIEQKKIDNKGSEEISDTKDITLDEIVKRIDELIKNK